MTDIGFGLLDRRTVITVLFTLVLMQLLFGLQIPIDIKNVVQLFIDLVVLTGYIYLARTIYRLPVAIIGSTISSARNIKGLADDVLDSIKEAKKESQEQSIPKKSNWFKRNIKIWLLWLLLISSPVIFVLLWLVGILTFGEAIEKKYGTAFLHIPYIHYNRSNFLEVVFGILDRIGIVAIAAIATIPSFSNYVKIVGVGGLVVMITLFTLRGDFTALLKDILEKKKTGKDDDEEKTEPSIEIKNSKSSPVYVEIVNSNESPIRINNSQFEPLFIDFNSSYSVNSKYYGLPIHIIGAADYPPIPVRVDNSVLHVEVENYSLSVEVENTSSIPVEVTNVVKTEENF